MRDSTTIFYELKLKRTRKPLEVFEKMAKTVKKRGATKNWVCEYDENYFRIDFNDDFSETFVITFNEKKICKDFCKVGFPLSGELFDDEKKSEFKQLLNMLWSVRTSFSEMKITDDYGITECYLDTKVNKIALRELNDEELERAKRLFENGHTTINEFVTALFFDLRNLPYTENYLPFINRNTSLHYIAFWDSFDKEYDFYGAFAESFLLETTEYKNEGRLYTVKDYYGDLSGVWFSVFAFTHGILALTGRFRCISGDPKSAQVTRLFQNKYLPLLNEENDAFGKCVLAYRFIVSIMDFLGFKYVGRSDKRLEQIEPELAEAAAEMLEKGDKASREKYLKIHSKLQF